MDQHTTHNGGIIGRVNTVAKGRHKMNEFKLTFQITKKVIFEVSYYTLGSNKHPYFATSAASFNQPKSDFNQCGQCQNDVLRGEALKFYKKWDHLHLEDLTLDEYAGIVSDIDELKKRYNWINTRGFSSQRELSKMELKKDGTKWMRF